MSFRLIVPRSALNDAKKSVLTAARTLRDDKGKRFIYTPVDELAESAVLSALKQIAVRMDTEILIDEAT